MSTRRNTYMSNRIEIVDAFLGALHLKTGIELLLSVELLKSFNILFVNFKLKQ